MERYILNIILPHINQWVYYALFVMTFLETSAFLGFLVPGESMVVIAGLLASRGVLELDYVIYIATLGAIAGDTVGYFIGRSFGEKFLTKYGKYFFIKKEHLDEAKEFFNKHGGKTVFLGRFMAWLRAFSPVIAGISKMLYPKFLFFNVVGGIAWATTFSLVGYFVGNSWDIIKTYLGRMGVFAFIGAITAIYIYFLFTKRRRLVYEKVGWIDRKISFRIPKTWNFMKDRFRVGYWYGLNLTVGIVLLILALLSFWEIVEDLMDKEALFYLDFRIQRLLEQVANPEITRFMVDITNIGGVYLAIMTVGFLFIYLFHHKDWWGLYTLFLVAGVGEIFLVILKLLFHRPRPEINLSVAHGYSFPSGHAFAAMVIYGFLIYVTWKSIKSETLRLIVFLISVLLIIFVGVSRIYLNVHWLTDVLGGYTSGFAWLVFNILTVNTVKQYYKVLHKNAF
jgi:undecaprenyl-diphosphatase